jgi:hypothetical protein
MRPDLHAIGSGENPSEASDASVARPGLARSSWRGARKGLRRSAYFAGAMSALLSIPGLALTFFAAGSGRGWGVLSFLLAGLGACALAVVLGGLLGAALVRPPAGCYARMDERRAQDRARTVRRSRSTVGEVAKAFQREREIDQVLAYIAPSEALPGTARDGLSGCAVAGRPWGDGRRGRGRTAPQEDGPLAGGDHGELNKTTRYKGGPDDITARAWDVSRRARAAPEDVGAPEPVGSSSSSTP